MTPTSGTIEFDGKVIELSEPRQAYTLGMATVHQDVGTIPLMSVARNFCLGSEPTKGWGPTPQARSQKGTSRLPWRRSTAWVSGVYTTPTSSYSHFQEANDRLWPSPH